MDARILLCSDLDRTILPNGEAPESAIARPLLRAVAQRHEITLAYVTGRNLDLIDEAILQYQVPVPDFAIGDVGTTIYRRGDGYWQSWNDWQDEIGRDWGDATHDDLAQLLQDVEGLRLQEPRGQNRFKLSYDAPIDWDRRSVLPRIRRRLEARGVRASCIWSVDMAASKGLLDVLPERATKLHAIEFLMERNGFDERRTVIAGDSGNDLPALSSGLQAVLVRNADEQVREQAPRILAEKGLRHRLYLATGGFLGMNGNYAAGVLEGLAHFLPVTRKWLTELQRELANT